MVDNLNDPIEELLNRIRWHPEFVKGDFEINYEDHIEHKVIRLYSRNIVLNLAQFKKRGRPIRNPLIFLSIAQEK
jgi:uncharacterized protein (UPF0248 family)